MILMVKLFTPLSLVQGGAFKTHVSGLDSSINQVSRPFVHMELIPYKSESLKFQVKDFLNKCG